MLGLPQPRMMIATKMKAVMPRCEPEWSRLKHHAIDATTDAIVAENLLARHGDDSGLLMYHGRRLKKMSLALDELYLASQGGRDKTLACLLYRHKEDKRDCEIFGGFTQKNVISPLDLRRVS